MEGQLLHRLDDLLAGGITLSAASAWHGPPANLSGAGKPGGNARRFKTARKRLLAF
ncbi:MAG: hypothetical protein ACOC8J_08205 [Ralstonia sp.]|jgi:hypothetical protein